MSKNRGATPMTVPPPRAQPRAVPEDLLQALQRLRYEISGKERIAASTLFPDATLQEICRKLPRDKKQLAGIEGMGVFRANRYGDEVLKLIEQYAPAQTARKEQSGADKPARKTKKAPKGPGAFAEYKERILGEGKTDAYSPWSPAEDEQLKEEFQQQMTLKEMSDAHKRTRGAVLARLRKLGLT